MQEQDPGDVNAVQEEDVPLFKNERGYRVNAEKKEDCGSAQKALYDSVKVECICQGRGEVEGSGIATCSRKAILKTFDRDFRAVGVCCLVPCDSRLVDRLDIYGSKCICALIVICGIL